MSVKEDVELASGTFYAALNSFINGDTKPMKEIWWNDESVTTGHPIGTWVRGYPSVMDTWESMLAVLTGGGRVEVSDLTVHGHGDFAYTIGIEHAYLSVAGKDVSFTAQATNIYRKVDGRWLIVHHHVERAPTFQAAVMS